ncbi:hypothetical protein NQ317_014115 [Molorchus minor]|uniref:THAP-type domain-containing protein n=1 Tax=Molorchus minor TaxID=1323400 RepID=A0ABQ9JNB5_9CUCU|nr:hypothetical protein NQ317_014115 [Molorchus minor]
MLNFYRTAWSTSNSNMFCASNCWKHENHKRVLAWPEWAAADVLTKTAKTQQKQRIMFIFFHYPVKHKERCKIWIENANKPQFCDLEEDQLRNKVICEYHFEDRWFPNSQKKRLLQGAVPTLDGDAVEDPVPEPTTCLPSQLHDVQILPANEDGTIFVLDTDAMFNRSQKVESYIYKNGVILPAEKLKYSTISKPSTKNQENMKKKNQNINPILKKEVPEYSENVLNKQVAQTITQIEDFEEQEEYETPNTNFPQKKITTRFANVKNATSKTIEKSGHSRRGQVKKPSINLKYCQPCTTQSCCFNLIFSLYILLLSLLILVRPAAFLLSFEVIEFVPMDLHVEMVLVVDGDILDIPEHA